MVAIEIKHKLERLISNYLSGRLDASAFCDAFYQHYDLDLNLNTLTEPEKQAYSALSRIADRFTDAESDLQTYPGVYVDKTRLDAQIQQTANQLGIHS